MTRVRVIGPGRAGGSFAAALAAAGWDVAPIVGRHGDLRGAARGVDLVLLCVPDGAVAEVAAAVEPSPVGVVAHVSGSLGLAPLAAHPRRAVVHPLVALPEPVVGAERLHGAWFGVAADGDPLARDLVAALGGQAVEVAEGEWPRYHAAAVIASNHLVALLGQVARVAAAAGAPLEAYLPLVRGTVDNVEALGPADALTGPVRRGDWGTVARHREVLPPEELPAYDAMVEEAKKLCRERGERHPGERAPASRTEMGRGGAAPERHSW